MASGSTCLLSASWLRPETRLVCQGRSKTRLCAQADGCKNLNLRSQVPKGQGNHANPRTQQYFFFSFQCKVLTLYGVVKVFLPMIMAKRRKMCCSAPMRCSWPVNVEVMAAPISHHDPMAASSSIPLLPSEMGHCLPNPCRGSQLMTKIYLALLKNI